MLQLGVRLADHPQLGTLRLSSFGRRNPRCSAFNFAFGDSLLEEGMNEPEVGFWNNRRAFHWVYEQ